jgi:hypothetical protein
MSKMSDRTAIFLITGFVILLVSSFASAQDALTAGHPVTVSLEPGESRSYRLTMRQDDYAEVGWKAPEGVYLHFWITDPTGD